MDVAEIGLKSLAREMPQRNEGFLMLRSMLPHVALHLDIDAAIAVLVANPPEDQSGGMSLLARCGFVVNEDLVDDRLKRTELGSRSVPGQRLGMRFRMRQGMPDGRSRVSELPGDLSDGQTITPSPANRAIIIHGNHVLGLRVGDRSM